jgi:hypothetical protein
MTSFLHVDLQIAAIGKRRTMIIFAKIYRFRQFVFVIKYRKWLLKDFIFYSKPLYKSLHQSFFYSFITILPSESGVTLHCSTIFLLLFCWSIRCGVHINVEMHILVHNNTWDQFFFLHFIKHSYGWCLMGTYSKARLFVKFSKPENQNVRTRD